MHRKVRRDLEFLILNSISSILPDFQEHGLHKTKLCTHQLKPIILFLEWDFKHEVLLQGIFFLFHKPKVR